MMVEMMLKERLEWTFGSTALRIAACIVICALVLVIRGAELAAALRDPLGLAAYIIDGHTSPWLVGVLCVLYVASRRSEIRSKMQGRTTRSQVLVGAAFMALAGLLPAYPSIAVGVLGAFWVFFGPAARLVLPAVVAYTIVMVFPVLVGTYAEVSYASTVVGPLALIVQLIKLPVTIFESNISLVLPSSEKLNLSVAAECAGPTTMALFFSLFTLMYAYRPLPMRTALLVLVVGITATWLQNVVRILAIVTVGGYFGAEPLWSAHEFLSYILFPLSYSMFAVFYISVVNQKLNSRITYR